MRIKVLSGGRKNIELSLSDAELNFQMRRIGIEETVPMCRLVEVSEKDNPLHRFEGQTVNMDEVNFFAKRMESLTEYERKVLSAYAEDYGVATMKDLINLTFSMKGLSLLTDFSDARQVGVRLYMDEFLGMSEEEKEQTNFIEFAEKTLKESRVEVLPYGVFVEHGFEMLEVYNGKTFPAFVASEETVAVVEVQNKTGDTEYLYLPTDICSMNKVKERLQVQDYWEMEVIEIENLRLPDILVPTTEDLREVEQLTLFNEMCHAVKRFDEVKMNQLAMVVEFTGLCDFPDVAYIATHLGEFEINPFVSTITQELKNSRDVLSMLEHYKENAGAAFRKELDIVCADMRSSSYEAALTRFEARLNSPQLSDVVRGLIGVLRGDDGAVYFQMLTHDFKQTEFQRLKAKAAKIPPKIRVYSFAMLMCFLATYFAIIIYEIIRSMGTLF